MQKNIKWIWIILLVIFRCHALQAQNLQAHLDHVADGVADCFDTEECDGLDNDGDTAVDEGFDLASDSHNCGVCGHSCGTGMTCQGGVCVADVDCDANAMITDPALLVAPIVQDFQRIPLGTYRATPFTIDNVMRFYNPEGTF
jgi:hypothetical protein